MPNVFYGWWVVVAATAANALQTAVFTAGAQTLVLPLIREFNTTRAAVSFAFSLRQLEGGLTGPLEGYMIHWFGAQRFMMVGWVIFGIGFVAVGLSQNIYHFYAAFLVLTLGQSMAGFLPLVTVLVNWFQRGRGRAIAIFQMGNSIGALFIPILAWAVLNVGWRESMIAVGILMIGVGLPLAWLMKPDPESVGLRPDGDAAPAGDDAADAGANGDAGDITVRQALRSRNFWFLGLAHSSSLTAWGALQVHLIPAMADMGQSEQVGALVLSVTLFMAAPGRLIGGFLGDILGRRRVLVAAFIGQTLAVVVLAFASTFTHAMVFAVLFGVAFGARGTLVTVLRGDVFGRKHFSRISGLMDPLLSVSMVASPIFAGWSYDVSGDYRVAFLFLAAFNGIGAFLIFGIRGSGLTKETQTPEPASP